MITLDQFRESSFNQKCDVVTLYSTYITMRTMKDCKIYLYHTGEYFVEVVYSTMVKRVLSIHAFNDLKNLECYIDTISLADLNV